MMGNIHAKLIILLAIQVLAADLELELHRGLNIFQVSSTFLKVITLRSKSSGLEICLSL